MKKIILKIEELKSNLIDKFLIDIELFKHSKLPSKKFSLF
jgi:hypothetical protein